MDGWIEILKNMAVICPRLLIQQKTMHVQYRYCLQRWYLKTAPTTKEVEIFWHHLNLHCCRTKNWHLQCLLWIPTSTVPWTCIRRPYWTLSALYLDRILLLLLLIQPFQRRTTMLILQRWTPVTAYVYRPVPICWLSLLHRLKMSRNQPLFLLKFSWPTRRAHITLWQVIFTFKHPESMLITYGVQSRGNW